MTWLPVSEARKKDSEDKEIGLMQLDATYSPVLKVSYSVDDARVEQRTDLDKIKLSTLKLTELLIRKMLFVRQRPH